MALRNVSRTLAVWGLSVLALIGTAQTPVPVGAGSYASQVPADRLNDDGFYGPTPATMLAQYPTLFQNYRLAGTPPPTNHWWTDLLIAERGGGGNWYQQQFDANGNAGKLWAYPGVVQPSVNGMNLYFPKRFLPNTSGNNVSPQGQFDLGPALRVDHSTGFRLVKGDRMLGSFMGTTYPAGWTATGDLVGTAPVQGGSWPGQSPEVSGLVGGACLNTFRGSDSALGTLSSPTFTIGTNFIDLKVGGGSDVANTVVQLWVDGTVVKTAVGQQDGALRWTQWSVAAYKGKQAQIVIRDSSQGAWGFIMCNLIVATNNAAPAERLFSIYSQAYKTEVTNYSDWAVDYSQTDAFGSGQQTTVARGVPFVWSRYHGIDPQITVGTNTTFYDVNNVAITPSGGAFTTSALSFDMTDSAGVTHTYGIYAPDSTLFRYNGTKLTASRPAFLVYAFLPNRSSLATYLPYAFNRVSDTQMTWTYNTGAKSATSLGGSVDTTWRISTVPLKGTGGPTLQGFLPHHTRTTLHNLTPLANTFATPRGTLSVVPGNQFSISFPFRGIAPVLPAPRINGVSNDYDASRMQTYLSRFSAAHPTSNADTYFQGKELGLTAQYMTLAARTNDATSFYSLQGSLRAQFQDWYSFASGKARNYFAWYPGWGSLVGFNSGFGSPAFNDHHFHYGYYALASALLGMHDEAFLNDYGEFAKLLCKDYNNWDRSDNRFPYMRCFDVWEGHSNAGGTSGPDGENQESSSEAMNAWVGMFLLGNMLGDTQMAGAGAMGYAIESTAVNEYWQDWKSTNFPAGYGKKTNGILFAGANAYATYFSGDPAWIYGIQWTPSNHWNAYLTRDKPYAAAQLQALWQERQLLSDYNAINNPSGFRIAGTNDAAGLGAYPGAYVLGFQALFDQAGAALNLDNAWAANQALATDATYPGCVYYLTHSLRGLGDPDPSTYLDLPTSQVYKSSAGVKTYVAFNPARTPVTAKVYVNGTQSGTLLIPARGFVSTTTLGGSSTRVPYYGVPQAVPGTLSPATYDYGGAGVAYSDSTPTNTGGKFRPQEGVDISTESDGSPYLSDITVGEWSTYTVNVAKSGPYVLNVRYASPTSATFHIDDELGNPLTGPVSLPSTGGSSTFNVVSVNATLTSGTHIFKVVADTSGFNLGNLVFWATGSAANVPFGTGISLKSVAANLYVCADSAGTLPLIANRTSAAGWETFTPIDLGGGMVGLLASANGKYVSLDTTNQAIALAATAGAAERFQWIDLGSGLISLRSSTTGKLLYAPNSTSNVTALGSSFGAATQFRWATVAAMAKRSNEVP